MPHAKDDAMTFQQACACARQQSLDGASRYVELRWHRVDGEPRCCFVVTREIAWDEDSGCWLDDDVRAAYEDGRRWL